MPIHIKKNKFVIKVIKYQERKCFNLAASIKFPSNLIYSTVII